MSGIHIRVIDEENLYRRIPNFRDNIWWEDGKIRLSSSAFNDRYKKPSVNRKALLPNPSETQENPSDGVVFLIAVAIRSIAGMVSKNDRGKVVETNKMDVVSDPIINHPELPDNPAHALIVSDPDGIGGESFKRLKEALAFLVLRENWLIPSQEELQD